MTHALRSAESSHRVLANRQQVDAWRTGMLERERWPREQLLAYQQSSLSEIVQYAAANSPYYGEILGDVRDGEIDLQQLPVLTKTTLMGEFDRIVTDRRLRLADVERHLASDQAGEPMYGEYRIVATGGTTGQRGVVVYSQDAWEISVANVQRVLGTMGLTPETRVLGIGAPTPLHVTNRLFAELRSGRTDTPRLAVTMPLTEVVEALNAYQPEAVITYPTYIRRLAEEQSAGRLRISPRKFASVAEPLTPDVRELARQTWGAAVLNSYGSTEAGVIAQECPWATGLHVVEDLLLLEVVDRSNRPVPTGVAGEKVLVTNLFNRTLPLIRYELSDLVTVADGPCPCGRPHLRLSSIEGRREDLLSLPARDGGRVSVHAVQLEGPLLRIPEVRQFQVSPRDDGLLVRLVLRERASLEEVLRSARQAIETELDRANAAVETLTIETVDQIAGAGTSAKQKLVGASD
jgi:putative adenylate-forming enzyme